MENIIYSSFDITRKGEVSSSFFVKHFETELRIFVILHWKSRRLRMRPRHCLETPVTNQWRGAAVTH